jgi:hypothetical protein
VVSDDELSGVEVAARDLLEAAWRLVRAYRAERRPAADRAAEPWLTYIVENGGAPYAWRAVDLAWERDDHREAVWWTARANGLQAEGTGVEVAPDLFAPLADRDEPGRIRCGDPSVLIESSDRAAAERVLAAARKRLGLVNELGHEYADEDEAQTHLASFEPGYDGDAYTVNYVSGVEQRERGPWLWMDGKGGLSGPMAGGMLGVLLDEVQKVGLTGVRLASPRADER